MSAPRFSTLTGAEVLGYWNAGAATVADLRFTGSRAIRRHREDADPRNEMSIALAAVAVEPWASHVWHCDPRTERGEKGSGAVSNHTKPSPTRQ